MGHSHDQGKMKTFCGVLFACLLAFSVAKPTEEIKSVITKIVADGGAVKDQLKTVLAKYEDEEPLDWIDDIIDDIEEIEKKWNAIEEAVKPMIDALVDAIKNNTEKIQKIQNSNESEIVKAIEITFTALEFIQQVLEIYLEYLPPVIERINDLIDFILGTDDVNARNQYYSYVFKRSRQ